MSILQPAVAFQAGQQPLEHLLVKEGHLLSLHALLLKQGPPEHKLPSLLEWLPAMCLREDYEHKVALLWQIALRLLVVEASSGRSDKVSAFSQYLDGVGEDRGWDILVAIGLRKQYQPSVRLRILARVTNALVLAQFPKCSDVVCPRTGANAPGALQNLNSSSM